MTDLHQLDIQQQREQIELWHNALWTGYSEQAKAALSSLRYSGEANIRRRANWSLARWYASAGRYKMALSYLNELVRNEPYVYAKATVALSICYSQLNQPEAIKQLLDDPNFAKPSGFDGLSMHYNSISCANHEGIYRRVSILNELFRNQGLAELKVDERAHKLSLSALRSEPIREQRPMLLDHAQPIVSIIIPAYNCADTISMVLQSLLAQEWPNIELIVVDDHSSDQTRECVAELASQHPCIRLICLSENSGAYYARNCGMREAQGDYLTVHDSDDWSHPAKIRLQVEALLDNEDAEASVSYWTRVDQDFNMLGLWMVGGSFVEFNHSSTLLRRHVVEQQGYWDEVQASADSEYLWRLQNRLGEGAVQAVVPDLPLSFSLVRKNALTQQQMTHVRTMHAGVRRLYREAARWWHKHGGRYIEQGERPAFPVPEGLKKQPLLKYAQVFAVDPSSSNEDLNAVLQRILSIKSSSPVAILVWYSKIEHSLTEIEPQFFAWCQAHDVHLIHPGITVVTDSFLLTDELQLSNIPDSLPELKAAAVEYCTHAVQVKESENSEMLDFIQVLLGQGLQPIFD